MEEWKHPIALELKHEEKIIGGKLSKRQFLFLVPALVVSWYTFSIPFEKLYGLFLPATEAKVFKYGTCGIIALIIMIIAAIISFIPARLIPFFHDPKPKANIDPYDVDMTIDKYIIEKIRSRGKKKILPYKIIR